MAMEDGIDFMKGGVYKIKKEWIGKYPPNPENEDSWIFEVEFYSNRYLRHVPLSIAKLKYQGACVLYAMENKLPKKFPQGWG